MKKLLIIFLKNPAPGKVKTRLAVDIGHNLASVVYKKLIEQTKLVTEDLRNIDVAVYFSDHIETQVWETDNGKIQFGEDLGERMNNAFNESFQLGYESVICIGTDLPDLDAQLLYDAFDILETRSVVIGPSNDGGYYLIGMNSMFPNLFTASSGSTELVLQQTLERIKEHDLSYDLLQSLNDIDTYDDLKKSSIYQEYLNLLQK